LGFAAAAASFCRELSNQKELEIGFMSEGIPRELPKETSFSLFHVLREVLENVAEHSGSRVQVVLSVQSNEIHLTVRDSGVGFDPEEAP
jgi:signal transduction histidine kinase